MENPTNKVALVIGAGDATGGAIADAYLTLRGQPRTAWTHELDRRPRIETWWTARCLPHQPATSSRPP